MNDTAFVIVAMATKCREVIRSLSDQEEGLPIALHPTHLLWMCDQIEKHADTAPATRLHRWIGFIQAGILANRALDLDGIKAMFNQIQKQFNISSEQQDLIDHLDINSSFEFDIGGQG